MKFPQKLNVEFSRFRRRFNRLKAGVCRINQSFASFTRGQGRAPRDAAFIPAPSGIGCTNACEMTQDARSISSRRWEYARGYM